MPKTRKTLDEQLASLKQKKEAIEKQLNAVETRKRETDRKLDTRRKIIVGGAVLAHSRVEPDFRPVLQVALEKAVAPKDRPLVADLIRSGTAEDDNLASTRPSSGPSPKPEAVTPRG
ncbi:hypothetical protein [Candidatus Binatus sp.]|uniref:hypothetical protein n=1 Tax=Candidatus Binatus sp. TaxID=2811406 RepID=UPI003BE43834